MKIRRFLCVLMTMLLISGATLCSGYDLYIPAITASAAKASDIPAPDELKIQLKDGKAVLEWSAVEGAYGYRIYKYDSAAKKYAKFRSVTGTRATFSGLAKGTHYFKVAALVKSSGGKYTEGKISGSVKITVKGRSGSSAAAPAAGKNSASDALDLAKKMGKGWNLGNTMEATGSWINGSSPSNYETAWGQPITTKEMIEGVKKAGFDSVRIPVAWSNMMSDDGKYTINSAYFKRVDEIVGYVIDSGMYCIINIHWDGGWWDDFGVPDKSAAAMKKYKAVWTQIAKHYAGYSDKLIFESANEELGSATKGNSGMEESYKRVNTINQTFVDIVRASGGNNADRFLLIAGYDTSIDRTIDTRFVMPKDKAKNRLLVSVHYYSPSTFCIADKSSNSWGYMGSWGSSKDISDMKKEFAKLKKFTDKGYGVVIGEYGVTHCTDDGKYAVKDGTYKFFQSVCGLSAEYGCCAMLWDCNDWYNRNTGKFNSDELTKIYGRKK